MQKAIIITNWCLIVFGGMSIIGWTGSLIAWKRCQAWFWMHSPHSDIEDGGYIWVEIFSGLLYIAFTVFALAALVRFILFLITGG